MILKNGERERDFSDAQTLCVVLLQDMYHHLPTHFYARDLWDAQLGAPQHATAIKQMTGNWQHAVDLLSETEWKVLFSTDLLPFPLHSLLLCLQVSKAALKLKKSSVLYRLSIRFANVLQKLATSKVSSGSVTALSPLPNSTPQHIYINIYI